MPKFQKISDPIFKWAYVGELEELPRGLADSLVINELNPQKSKDAHKMTARYVVDALVVDWQRSWHKVEDNAGEDKGHTGTL
jgi:hypothetical protein